MNETFNGKRDAVLALDNEQLKQAVHDLAVAGGVDARQAERLARDPDKLRKKLASVTEQDIARMLSSLSKEQLAVLTAHMGK